MSLITITEDGLEIDGVVLKDTTDLKAYLSAHAPSSIEINIGMVRPKELPVEVGITRPQEILAQIGTSYPREIHIDIGTTVPRDIEVYLRAWKSASFDVMFNMHLPKDLSIGINLHDPHPLEIYVKIHNPIDLSSYLYPIPPHDLYINFQIFSFYDYPEVIIGISQPQDLIIYHGVSPPENIIVYLNPMWYKDLLLRFRVCQRGNLDLIVFTKAVRASSKDLSLEFHIWKLLDLYVSLGPAFPHDLTVPMWVWTTQDINTIIDTAYPQDVSIGIIPQPEDGVDLRVYHGFYAFESVSATFDIWTGLRRLYVDLYGLYSCDLNTVFTMGSYENLEVPLPMTTGYRNLYITLRPSCRVVTTIIPVYTIEMKDLYVSINQGWPCGFGSSYLNIGVSFGTAYVYALEIYLQTIYGSGSDMIGVFVNHYYFDTFMNSFDIKFFISLDRAVPDVVIADQLEVRYNNEFDNIRQNRIRVTFEWPRLSKLTGTLSFSVELYPFQGDKIYDLQISLVAHRKLSPIQPPAEPLVARQGLQDPIWPEVFQVTEIELWDMDPPELVRKVEIKFEEQVREYYWVSKDQKAYSKNLWERWAFLTRGYLPSAEYSGQIDYNTMRTLSSMVRYDTIDQAVKAMLSGFLYNGREDLRVSLLPHGSTSRLKVQMSIWDREHMRRLRVMIEPMHPIDLSVIITPV